MIVFTFLATLLSLLTPLFTLAAALVTAGLIPFATAVILGILELVTAIVASTESVLLLIFSPPILLFPLKLVRALGTPIVEGGLVVFAPVVYPLQALSICAAGVLAFLFEFKALYTFLASAALVGLVAGSFVHLTSSLLSALLGLDHTTTPAEPPAKETEEAPFKPVLHMRVTHPVPRPPRKSSLKRHPPVLRKHVPDGADGDVRPWRVKFRLADGELH